MKPLKRCSKCKSKRLFSMLDDSWMLYDMPPREYYICMDCFFILVRGKKDSPKLFGVNNLKQNIWKAKTPSELIDLSGGNHEDI